MTAGTQSTVSVLTTREAPLYIRAKASAIFFWQQEWEVDNAEALLTFKTGSEDWQQDELRKASLSLGTSSVFIEGRRAI